MIRNIFYKLLIPFAIIHIRWIQYRYKYITLHRNSSHHLYTLILLQCKEYYYKKQFSAWGNFHPSFSFSEDSMKRHIRFMNWLFPEKYFKQDNIVIWHNPEAITYYHNKIYELQNQVPPLYEVEIPKQIKEWKTESEKYYLKNK